MGHDNAVVEKVRYGKAAPLRFLASPMATMGRPYERPKYFGFNSSRDFESTFKLNTNISNGAVQFRMSKEQLHGAQIASRFCR